MIDMIKKLYGISGNQSTRITKMFIFDILKTIFEGMSLLGVIFLLIKTSDMVLFHKVIVKNDIYLLFLIMIISTVGKIISAYLADKNKNIAAYEIGAEIRIAIGDRLKKVNMGFFNQNRLGEITGGLTTCISELETVGILIIEGVVVGVLQTIIMGVFIIPFDFVTGCIVIITIIIGTLGNLIVQNKTDKYAKRLQRYKVNLNSTTLEYIMGIGVVKAFGKTEKILNKIKKSIRDTRKGYFDIEKLIAPFQFIYLSIFKSGICAIIISSVFRYLDGSLDIQKTIILIASSFIVFNGIESAGLMQSIRGIALQNLNKIYELKNLEIIKDGTLNTIKSSDIEVKNIEFAYEQDNVINNISFYIPEGKTTALVGPSGCGKSTLCYLIARFWDINSGQIKIGGEEIKNYNYDFLLSNISMVFQDVYLFEDTIKNNIRFGNPNATDEEVMEIAKKACCHDFIMDLPEGYDTILQEGGKNLSGGERQRISIARAMIKDSKFIILDEATSSIDPENEKNLVDALNTLLRGKTSIIIAHRLSTIRNSDQILVMDGGNIVQRGNHEELMKKSGIYSDFVSIRNQALSWELK